MIWFRHSSFMVLATRGDGPAYVELIYRFLAPAGGLSAVSASLTGVAEPGLGGVNTLALSYNGRDWTDSDSSNSGVSETITVNGGATYTNREAFYVHVRMAYDSTGAQNLSNIISNLEASCTHDAGATPIPDPGKCGDAGYLSGDISGPEGEPDCYVDIFDFSALTQQWQDCTDPAGCP